MLVGTSKAVAQRLAATSNSSRSFACTAAPLSPSLSSQATQRAQPDRPRADPHRRLVDRIVQLAVRGSQEVDQRLEDPSRNQSSTVQAGYKPTPRRQTPSQPLPWIGTVQTRAKQRRGKLVAYQVDRRNGSQLAQAAQSRSASARRGSAVSAGDLIAQDKPLTSRRSFSSSPSSHLRLDEASLAVNDDTVDGGGLWDDAEAGENFKSGKKGKARELRPGDWVDTSRAGQQVCGIYICRSFATVRRGTILASSGEMVDVSMDDIISIVPSVVAARLATQLGDHLEATIVAARVSNNAEADVEAANSPMVASDRPETLEILQALRQVEIDIERETQLLAANGVHDIYRIILSAAAATAPTSVTVSSALSALRVPNKSSRARSLALTRILLAQPQHFIADPLTLRQTGRFDLRPLEEVERFELAREWVRERSPEVEAWAEKCARVRQWSRDQKAASSYPSEVDANSDGAAALPLRPLPANDPDFSWSESDLVLFGFLRDTLARERLLQMQPHLAIAPSLIKLVDATTSRLGLPEWEQTREVQRSRIRDFLAEVGIVAEWEDWVAHEAPKGLRSWDEIGDKVAAKLARARERSSSPAPSGTPSPTDFYPLDPHDSVRHDFGSATVFTIDDPSASELDDGISIAAGPPTANGTATWWVHVHIADPTALLHPNHLLTNLARLRDHTVYFPEYTWSMLPDTFTVEQKLSLGSNGQAGQRVLTLGMRIDEASGEVVESEVKAGIVRDVRRLTYGAVEKVLGYKAPQAGRTISNRDLTDAELEAEANRARRPTDDAALPTDTASLDQLSTLHRLAKKLMRRRVESSALFWQFPSSSVSVSPKPIRPHFETLENPLFHSRPPRISVRLPSEGDHSYVDSPANLLVSEMMVAANRVAARFAVERGIAVPFRQQGAPTALPQDLEAVLKLRDPDSGIAPAREVLKRRIEFLPGETTPTPGPHWPMGINDEYGYLRVTSPLRRYSDLFSHYQLKGALLPESSMGAFAPRAGLPAVLTQIEGFNAAAKARHRLDGAAQSYWSLWVIKQKVDLLNAMTNPTNSSPFAVSDEDQMTFDLLANGLTALAYRQPVRSTLENLYVQSVLIPQLGVRGALRLEKPEHGPEVGEEVPVKVEDIALGPRSRIVVGLRR